MGLTTALFSAQSGLASNGEMVSVVGNNIANANTTGFKAGRISFETQISTLIKAGSAPTADLGGSNPAQLGLGTKIASVERNFNPGPLNPTGVKTDLAVEGDGFFIVKTGDGIRYTRDGQFSLDKNYNLVRNGAIVQGYGIDENFDVVEGVLQDVVVPVGRLSELTQNIQFDGNLNAGGDVALQGSLLNSEALFSDAAATTNATATTALTSLFKSDGSPILQVGDTITIDGATRGGKKIGKIEQGEVFQSTVPYTFEVTAVGTTGSGAADFEGSTLDDLTTFLNNILGIDTTLGAGGVSINAGQITIDGNLGTSNDLNLDDAHFQVTSNGSTTAPLEFTKTRSANGESVRTSFFGFDSIGNQLNFDMSIVLEQKNTGSTVWRFYAYTDDTTADAKNVGTGTLTFDGQGQLVDIADNTLNVTREALGAVSPQPITLQFDTPQATITAFSDQNAQISMIDQDGSPFGTLQDFIINEDGVISGVFTNGLLRDLGRVPVALFANNNGLIEEGSNLYNITVNTGTPQIVTAGSNGAGRLIAGALEGSNVELSQEFINLITASTGFSASSRVLSTADRLVQELINSIR